MLRQTVEIMLHFVVEFEAAAYIERRPCGVARRA